MVQADDVTPDTKAGLDALGIISPPKQQGAAILLAFLRHGDARGRSGRTTERLNLVADLQAKFQGKSVRMANGDQSEIGIFLYITAQGAGRALYQADDGLWVRTKYRILAVVRWPDKVKMHGTNVIEPIP